MSVVSSRCVVGLSVAAWACGALAQSQFQVDAAGRAQPLILDPLVVTATRVPQSAVDLVSDIDVVPTAGLRASGAQSMPEQLGTLSGIEIQQSGGPGSSTGLFLRGAGSGQSLTLIDGFRVSSVSLGQPVYETLPFGLTDRTEVLRGPASGLYGADAIGGVIQLFTPTARPGTAFAGEAALGSLGTRQLGGSIMGGSASLTGGLHLSDARSDGFNAQRPGSFGFNDDDDGFHRRGILAHATAQLSAASQLRGLFMRNEVDSAFDDGDFDDARAIKRSDLVGVTSETALSDASILTLKLGRNTDRIDSRSSFGGAIESDQDQLGVAVTRPVAPGVNFRLSYDRLVQSVTADDYGAGGADERRTSSYGVSLSGREGQHLVQVSLRRDSSNQFEEQTNGTFSYGYVLASGMRVGGAYATGFRAPAFNDLYYPGYGRPGIKPEQSRSLEFGAYWDQRSQDRPAGWHGKLVAFRNQIEDLIVFVPDCPVDTPEYASGCADNVNRADIRGVSLSLGTRTGGFTWQINADWLDPVDETLDKRLVRRAKQQLGAVVGYQWDRVLFSGTLKAAGDRFDDSLNTQRLGGYATANLSAIYAFQGGLKAFVKVINVADRDHSTAAGFRSQPRTTLVGIRYDTP